MAWCTPKNMTLAIALTLAGLMSPAYAEDWKYDCENWVPSSLLHRGPIEVVLSDDQLTWSNERRKYSARFVDGSRTRKTYVDDASVYFVYGLWIPTSSVKSRLKIVRVFYNAEMVQFSELNCQEG